MLVLLVVGYFCMIPSYHFSSVVLVLTQNLPHFLCLWCPVTLSLVSCSPLQSASIPDALCDRDTDCLEGEAVVAGNGKGHVPV